MEYQTIKGEKVPSLGLGTYRLTGGACVRAVERGLQVGYRHLDTAQMYGNEAEVGRGIRGSGVDRGEIFVTTKVWPSDFAHERVIRKTGESLKKLRTEYVDLLLMHWPGDGVPLGETLGAMRELQEEGSVLHIGVSNFSPSLVEDAAEHVDIFCNQVQYHPHSDQRRAPQGEPRRLRLRALRRGDGPHLHPWSLRPRARPRARNKGRRPITGTPRCDHRRRGCKGRALDHRARRGAARRR